jgi:hypothetical protein
MGAPADVIQSGLGRECASRSLNHLDGDAVRTILFMPG